jgi:hypothetical protein
VALTLSLGTTDAWAKTNVAPAHPPAAAESASARTRAEVQRSLPVEVSDDLYEYAEREARTAGLEGFEGGDVVIVTSAGLVVLLLVIIILLLL